MLGPQPAGTKLCVSLLVAHPYYPDIEVAQKCANTQAGSVSVTAKVGTVGFCSGGSLALWSATLSDLIVAAVGFYPPMPWERMSPKWSNYAGKSALIHCSEGDGTSAAPCGSPVTGIMPTPDFPVLSATSCSTHKPNGSSSGAVTKVSLSRPAAAAAPMTSQGA